MATPSEDVRDTQLFQRIENYPWKSDEEFQHGLQAILGSDPNPEQAEHLTLRARCFYFSRQALYLIWELLGLLTAAENTTSRLISRLTRCGTPDVL